MIMKHNNGDITMTTNSDGNVIVTFGRCEYCNVEYTSEIMKDTHLSGKKHLKNIKIKGGGGMQFNLNNINAINPGMTAGVSTNIHQGVAGVGGGVTANAMLGHYDNLSPVLVTFFFCLKINVCIYFHCVSSISRHANTVCVRCCYYVS